MTCEIFITRRPAGAGYYVSWTDSQGHHQERIFRTFRAARVFMRELKPAVAA